MNGTNVTPPVLRRLTKEWETLTPAAQKAARYVLENPQNVGVSTVREIAEEADVTPNTMVRMARQMGFDGYEEFRAPFRDAIRRGGVNFPDRARWLQNIRKSGGIGGLYADMMESATRNIEDTFAKIDTQTLNHMAEAIWNARHVYALGVGAMNANARLFAYLAATGMRDFHAIPRPGFTAIDDLAWADDRDVLIAMTCHPYRSEVVDAVRVARDQGVNVIALSDSPASPIIRAAQNSLVIATDTPQFFPSSVAMIAVLETLLSFVIAVASDKVVGRVETFHQRRRQLGLYLEEPE